MNCWELIGCLSLQNEQIEMGLAEKTSLIKIINGVIDFLNWLM